MISVTFHNTLNIELYHKIHTKVCVGTNVI